MSTVNYQPNTVYHNFGQLISVEYRGEKMNANKKTKTTIMASYHLSKSDNETMFEDHICACTFCSVFQQTKFIQIPEDENIISSNSSLVLQIVLQMAMKISATQKIDCFIVIGRFRVSVP